MTTTTPERAGRDTTVIHRRRDMHAFIRPGAIYSRLCGPDGAILDLPPESSP